MVRAVFFDVGETLVNEGRLWRLWAEWLKVPQEVFDRELQAVIEDRAHHRFVFERLRPGFDVAAARAERVAAGWPADLAGPDDLYPDAAICIEVLKSEGYWIGIAGNQPAGIEAIRELANLRADAIGSSGRWGVSKPSPAFFTRLIDAAPFPAEEIAYVGDRLDNDILPAMEAGLVGIFLRRGPWGRSHARWPEASQAHLTIDGLTELPGELATFNAAHVARNRLEP